MTLKRRRPAGAGLADDDARPRDGERQVAGALAQQALGLELRLLVAVAEVLADVEVGLAEASRGASRRRRRSRRARCARGAARGGRCRRRRPPSPTFARRACASGRSKRTLAAQCRTCVTSSSSGSVGARVLEVEGDRRGRARRGRPRAAPRGCAGPRRGARGRAPSSRARIGQTTWTPGRVEQPREDERAEVPGGARSAGRSRGCVVMRSLRSRGSRRRRGGSRR